MNLWECEAKRCKRTALGVGGARGLRAIGWFVSFRIGSGPVILCPDHHPDGIEQAKVLAAITQDRL